MNYQNLTLYELKSLGIAGDEKAILELGRKVLERDLEFCDEKLCEHLEELSDLQMELDNEIPPECPHCGKYI